MDNHDKLEIQAHSSQKEIRNTISLLDLLGVLAKHWKFIFFSCLIAAILIVGYSIYTIKTPPDGFMNKLPNVYKPVVKVRLQDDQNSASSILGSSTGLSTLASLAGVGSGSSSSVALAQSLLKENTIVDQIAEEFHFQERYKIQENPLSAMRKMINAKLQSDYASDSGILTISYSDTDKKLATDIVNRAVDLLEKRFKGLTMQKILNKKQFLEERVAEVNRDLKKAQKGLIQFQIDNGIVDVSVDSDTGSVELVFAQYVKPEKRYAITLEYYDRQRDKTILETIYKLLMQQYETSKIEEMDDSKTFQILEHAEVPELKDSPSRGKICIIVTFVVFFLSVFLSFIKEYFERVKEDPAESVKLEMIKKRFRNPKKRK